MHSHSAGSLPASDPTGRRRGRMLASLATIVAVLLVAVLPFPALAQIQDSRKKPSAGQPARVACDEATDIFQLLCIAYRVISNNHVDPVEDGDLAREAAERIQEEGLAERTEGTPPACALPAPEFEQVCLEIDAVEDSTTAVEMAIRGMVRALDSRSAYLTNAQYEQFVAGIENQDSTGLGLAFALAEDGQPCSEISLTCRPVITEVYDGSPADGAGLMVGDVLVELGDTFPAELGCREVVDLDRFPSGTSVAVTVRRDGKTISSTVEAANLAIPIARGQVIDGEIGLLRLDSFGSSAEADVRKVLDRLTDTGISGLVFDLRGTPGGYVDSAVGVAGLFLPDLTTVVQMVSREKVETVSARGKELSPDPALLPMVVVTDHLSASASELVTGALRDNGRVTVVGERTYGKNTGQSSYHLQVDGATVGVLHLTTTRWLTPHSRSAMGGLAPDVEMELPPCLPPAEVARRAISAMPDTFLPFDDVGDSVHRAGIQVIAMAGITQGCGAPDNREFCPGEAVTRGQMATFLSRSLNLPAAGRDHFTDDNGDPHEDSINSLAAAGITQGCNDTNDHYCPDQPITRGQMATLLARVLERIAAVTDLSDARPS